MKSKDIRTKFKNYFSEVNHQWVKSASLIPQKDPSLLFVNAGMNPFKNAFLGLEPPLYPQVCSIQKCLRAGGKHNDLEEVGLSLHHHTFFEMMGHFCFGSYFKRSAIDYAMQFLTKELYLPKERLWVSVFKEDQESAEIWKKDQNIKSEKILFLGEESNFWRMGKTGPCGPCSEIYFNPDPNNKTPKESELIEVWNLVFMSFNENKNSRRTALPKLCIDTGMGLERISMILQEKTSNYDTDLFTNIINAIAKESRKVYRFSSSLNDFNQKTKNKIPSALQKDQIAFRVIADHARAVSFLICDGVLPGSDGASYVLRRILRRAFFYSSKLCPGKNLLTEGAKKTIDLMQEFYPELNKNRRLILSTIKEENKRFSDNLKAGKKIFSQKINSLKKNLSANKTKWNKLKNSGKTEQKTTSIKTIPDADLWDLYSTYGFPLDLTRLIAQEEGFTVNNISLSELKQKMLHDKNFKKKTLEKIFNILPEIVSQANAINLPKTKKTCWQTNKDNGKILWIKKQETSWMILDKSCFYPEGGGPIGDKGLLQTNTGKAQVLDCQEQANFLIHKIKITEGDIKINQDCKMEVDTEHRRLISANHSATHLLHQSLREILGKNVKQKGSLVEPERLRFDFSYFNPLSEKQIKQIEEKVNSYIQEKSPVTEDKKSYEQALKEGALSLAGENYSTKVRVISMGESIELCGGIHVKNTSEIKLFKIISETGVQSGVRRITAYTSDKALKWINNLTLHNLKLRKYLNLSDLVFIDSQAGFKKILPKQKHKTNSQNNPFIFWWESQEKNIQILKKQLKNLQPDLSVFKEKIQTLEKQQEPSKIIIEEQEKNKLKTTNLTLQNNKFLAEQVLEFGKYLKTPITQVEEQNILFLPLIHKKEKEIQNLKKQLKNLPKNYTIHQLVQKAKNFKLKNIEGHLLSLCIPIEDRKILAEITDQLKSKLEPAVIIVLGEGETASAEKKYPIIVTVSHILQKDISADKILKQVIAPVLKGKGGGQARFSQGIMTDTSRFSELELILLKQFSKG